MADGRIADIYQAYVVAHDLERRALLAALRARCLSETTVLYPGASVHVTPSFFFQHVVYVDLSDLSRDFFARAQAVLDVVNRHKAYRQRPFIRFVRQDFTADLPVFEGSFDLLLITAMPGTPPGFRSSSCEPWSRNSSGRSASTRKTSNGMP